MNFKHFFSTSAPPVFIARLAPGVFILLLALVLSYWVKKSGQPLVDQHSFRQCQTALSAACFNWENPIKAFLNYETPVFGEPWQVPMEFPIYQSIVSAFAHILNKTSLNIPLSTIGRNISALFFFITFIPLYSISRSLDLGRRFFYISATLWLCSPLYLYWSRAFLIESTAVFFGFAFLAALLFAIEKKCWSWWGVALIFSIACALVKVTSYPAFGLAGLGVVLLKKTNSMRDVSLQKLLKPIGLLIGIGILTVVLTAAWTSHADQIKNQNIISDEITSTSLASWNYGTLQQKLCGSIWKEVVWNRTIPNVLGSYWVVGFIFACALMLRNKGIVIFVALILLFILPIALFTNLHFIHNYYQYANSFWLLLACGIAFSVWSRNVPWVVAGFTLLLIIFAQGISFYKGYFIDFHKNTSEVLEFSKIIKNNTHENSCIIVIGDDWSPDLAFFSGRRALYFPYWLSVEKTNVLLEKIKNSPNSLFGGCPIGATIIHRGDLWKSRYNKNAKELLERFFLENHTSKGDFLQAYEAYYFQ